MGTQKSRYNHSVTVTERKKDKSDLNFDLESDTRIDSQKFIIPSFIFFFFCHFHS